ncbi:MULTISPECIES: hypothetical protein [unclassified Thiocapsa]|uniref:hypothetical protein n=1 Tax=unclassified Thiocapsa TaxID=2641286 RepID=UPI0035B04DA0
MQSRVDPERLSWLRARPEPAPATSGGRRCRVGTLQDITEQKTADTALRESEAFLNAVLEILPFGIWHLNADGEIRFINVETPTQRTFLIEHGCPAFQGYLFGRPGGAEDLLAQSQALD